MLRRWRRGRDGGFRLLNVPGVGDFSCVIQSSVGSRRVSNRYSHDAI